MENKIEIEELKKELYLGDYGDCIVDYDIGYICDILTEIADNHVDIYYSDLFEWAKGNTTYIEEALDELGTPQYNGHTDFIGIIQQGQYYAYEQELYENLEDIIKFFVFDYIEKQLDIKEITNEQIEEIELEIDFSDNNEQLENIIDKVKEIFENEKE